MNLVYTIFMPNLIRVCNEETNIIPVKGTAVWLCDTKTVYFHLKNLNFIFTNITWALKPILWYNNMTTVLIHLETVSLETAL